MAILLRGLMLLAAALLLALRPVHAVTGPEVKAKRGHGIWLGDQVTCIRNFQSSFSWWYAWSPLPYTMDPVTLSASLGIEYVPMQWTPNKDLNLLDSNIAKLNMYQRTKVLLGWNEPDRADQANIPATTGAQKWYVLEQVAAKYNLRLGAPAIGSRPAWQDEWFRACDDYYCIESFKDALGTYGGTNTTCKAAATLGASVCKRCAGKPYGQRGCRADIMPVHIYNCNFSKWVAELNRRTAPYGLPIWITEFGCMPTWEWPAFPYDLSAGYTPMVAYMKQLLDYVDNRPDIERYAWWTEQSMGDGQYVYHQLYSSVPTHTFSPVGVTYNTYNLGGTSGPSSSPVPAPSPAPLPSPVPVASPLPATSPAPGASPGPGCAVPSGQVAVCLPGYGGATCQACPANTYSTGGTALIKSPACLACPTGSTSTVGSSSCTVAPVPSPVPASPVPLPSPAPPTSPNPYPTSIPAPSLAWNASLTRCSFTPDIMGLGTPLSTRACGNPSVDAFPGLRTSYDGPFQPSCGMKWWPSTLVCSTLNKVAKIVFLGDSLTKHVHDETFAVVRDDAEKGYMNPSTSATIMSTCKCQTPYLLEATQSCKNNAQSNTGRLQTEHWFSYSSWRYWYTSDLCGKSGQVEYFGIFNDWMTDAAAKTTMADLETVINQAGKNVFVVTGGTPPYNQAGTGTYNAQYNCDNVLKPIAALYSKYSIPFKRLLVLGMHKEELKGWSGFSDAKIQAFNSAWKACAQAYAPGSSFLDSYQLSTAGNQAATSDGLHAGLKLNLLKVQMTIQTLAANVP